MDNSISAGARRVDLEISYEGSASYVVIADDGDDMSTNGLLKALRFGARRSYGDGDLGGGTGWA